MDKTVSTNARNCAPALAITQMAIALAGATLEDFPAQVLLPVFVVFMNLIIASC